MLYLEARWGTRKERWPLRDGCIVVGRGPECDIVLDDAWVSRRHFQLEIFGQRIKLADLGSRHGVFHAEERIEEIELSPESQFVAGQVVLTIRDEITLDGLRALGRPVQHATAEHTRFPSDDPGALGALSALLASLDAAGNEASRLHALLAAAAERTSAKSAALLVRTTGGTVVRALWGAPLPEGLAAALDTGAPPRGGRLIALPGCAPEVGALALHPVAKDGDLVVRVAAALAGASLTRCICATEDVADSPYLAVSDASRRLLDEALALADGPRPILLVGEEGSGREALARQVHRKARRDGAFVSLDCSQSSAEQIVAALQPEHGDTPPAPGTLYLDGVEALTPPLQSALLRALGARDRRDLRLVTATTVDLEKATAEGQFDAELFVHLAGAELQVPPLRERCEDVLPLAQAFAAACARAAGRGLHGLDIDAARALARHGWPGNVRELREVVARAFAACEDEVLGGAAFAGLLAT